MYIDAQEPEIAATAPTDRSMPRVAMTSVIPARPGPPARRGAGCRSVAPYRLPVPHGDVEERVVPQQVGQQQRDQDDRRPEQPADW